MMILVGYVAVGAGTWPVFVRYRYGQIKRGHPHTHERDVARDAVLAMAQGAVCAALWLPIVVSRYTLRVGWWLARLVLGTALRRDFSAARVERLTAELATFDARDNVVDLRPSPWTPAYSSVDVAELRAAVREAEMAKDALNRADYAGDAARVAELRAVLREKIDAIDAIARRVSA